MKLLVSAKSLREIEITFDGRRSVLRVDGGHWHLHQGDDGGYWIGGRSVHWRTALARALVALDGGRLKP